MVRIRSLKEAWPLLQTRYRQLAGKDDAGVFPLLSTEQREQFTKNYKWDNKESGVREAAVLVVLCNVDERPSILFTRRSESLTLHASEISFPGGHYDKLKDESLQETALRETYEELMPPPVHVAILDEIQILGQATPLPSLKVRLYLFYFPQSSTGFYTRRDALNCTLDALMKIEEP
jgi:nudix motif 8